MESPAYEIKHHMVFSAQKGAILGLEDAVLGKTDCHNTTAVVFTTEHGADLYRIDKEAFMNSMKNSPIWPELAKKADHQIDHIKKAIRTMLKTNKQIGDRMRNKSELDGKVGRMRKEVRPPSKIQKIIENIEMKGGPQPKDIQNEEHRTSKKSLNEDAS